MLHSLLATQHFNTAYKLFNLLSFFTLTYEVTKL